MDHLLTSDQLDARLKALSTALAHAEQQEREALAEVLHDHLQPLLVAAQMTLIDTSHHQPSDTDSWQEALTKLQEYLGAAIETTRTLSVELDPPLLHDHGLGVALDWHGRQLNRIHGIAIGVHYDPGAEPQDLGTRLLCFKAVRELLLNAIKHAGVRRIEVDVLLDGEDTLLVSVSDRGKGFSPRPAPFAPAHHERLADPGGSGLDRIHQRLQLIGGSLTIESAPGRGTSAYLRIPLQCPLPAKDAQSHVTSAPTGHHPRQTN